MDPPFIDVVNDNKDPCSGLWCHQPQFRTIHPVNNLNGYNTNYPLGVSNILVTNHTTRTSPVGIVCHYTTQTTPPVHTIANHYIDHRSISPTTIRIPPQVNNITNHILRPVPYYPLGTLFTVHRVCENEELHEKSICLVHFIFNLYEEEKKKK